MMNDYKNTLNLPKTKFPMKANLLISELKILECWKKNNLYSIIRENKKGKKTFFLHDGPPYANGDIHIGHAVNKILKDIIIKFKSLFGFDAPYMPGWDCHGLPIELQVEKKINQNINKINHKIFREKCRNYALDQVNKQKKEFIRLGVIGDWNNPYLTMDFHTEANILRTFKNLIKKKYLYRGIKPINWCIDCKSSLSDSEIDYNIKESNSIDVSFSACDNNKILKIFNSEKKFDKIKAIIWTTTPWTIIANRAISVNPNFIYLLVKCNKEIFIIAESLLDKTLARLNIKKSKILGSVYGKKLKFLYFKHPLNKIHVPMILNEYVDFKSGSGIVHVAPNYGEEDYIIGKKYKLNMYDPIDSNGNYLPGTFPGLDGLNIFKSEEVVLNLLKNNHSLYSKKIINHSYPHCWRHKSPTFFRATNQWFFNIDNNNLRNKTISEIKKILWIPKWGMNQIIDLLSNRPDWCISRQRVWGVPIAVFINKKNKEIHPNTVELIEKVSKKIEKKGVQAWWDINKSEILDKDSDKYKKVLDTLDVWFDSGSTYYSILIKKWNSLNKNKVDLYLEGSDQYRGWFMSSIILSIAITGGIPCKKILAHGFVVDSNGKKMSKSIGNVISPKDIINEFGADILRLWVASSDYKSDISISKEILLRTVDIYRRIRNTSRFLLSNLNDFNPEFNSINLENMLSIDQWAIIKTNNRQKKIKNAYEEYNFHKVVSNIVDFCSLDMGSFYLDIIKDRQYTNYIDSLARRSCQTAILYIIECLVRWIMPILSFTSHEIWKYIPGKREKYVFLSEWVKEIPCENINSYISKSLWKILIKIKNEINKIIEIKKLEDKIKSSLELKITLYAESFIFEELILLKKELNFAFLVSYVSIKKYENSKENAFKSKSIKNLKILAEKFDGKKCLRCWNYTNDIVNDVKYNKICNRCINNINGVEEKRKYF
ncbi:ileS [Wigglesworthia glossinidia endosymbiont of Glossina brevipalpis]|uniref:Isoleucine--tRNA ligase n=1 Tax=Wigglesworthia glossinidia brevipalpis TaxID=36870 RepID=SYI_WIGBR|nr:RecName: Full=Isoleucine--tRNA ligase; AltName: Full=Isoleucyl-tRNA synthetase; Short=IleRS [Wigglesworthia glossinidia endosymbiont of Glossina brevipalpis]BAC24440.1 ileS [Wigglesworthia glossinidia endosymbiont of Glossina brevipalpis]